MFGSNNTNRFGTTTPAFGSSEMNSNQKPNNAFGGFNTTSTPAFGSSGNIGNTVGSGFGGIGSNTGGFGTTNTPAFGTSSTSGTGFGTATKAATPFGIQSNIKPTTGFGSGTSGGFNTFGQTPIKNNLFGSSNTGTSGTGSNTGFSAFGASNTTTANKNTGFGSTPFGISTPSTNTGGFGTGLTGTSSGMTSSNTIFGTESVKYCSTKDVNDSSGNSILICITSMDAYNTKTLEELRLEDYLLRDHPSTNTNIMKQQKQKLLEKKSAMGNIGFNTTTTTGGTTFGSIPSSDNRFGFGTGSTNAVGFGTGMETASNNAFNKPLTSAGFGSTSNTGFGATSTGGFGRGEQGTNAFGTSGAFGKPQQTPSSTFGSMSGTGFGAGTSTTTPAFGSTGGFGSFGKPASSTTAFGTGTSTPALGGGTAATFGSTSGASGSAFGSTGCTGAFGSAPSSSGGFGAFGKTTTTGFGTGSSAFGTATPSTQFGTSSTGFGTTTKPIGSGFGGGFGTGFGSGFGSTASSTATPSNAGATRFGSTPSTAGATGFGTSTTSEFGTGTTSTFGAAPTHKPFSSGFGGGGAFGSTTGASGFGKTSGGFGTGNTTGFGLGSVKPTTSAFGAAPGTSTGFGTSSLFSNTTSGANQSTNFGTPMTDGFGTSFTTPTTGSSFGTGNNLSTGTFWGPALGFSTLGGTSNTPSSAVSMDMTKIPQSIQENLEQQLLLRQQLLLLQEQQQSLLNNAAARGPPPAVVGTTPPVPALSTYTTGTIYDPNNNIEENIKKALELNITNTATSSSNTSKQDPKSNNDRGSFASFRGADGGRPSSQSSLLSGFHRKKTNNPISRRSFLYTPTSPHYLLFKKKALLDSSPSHKIPPTMSDNKLEKNETFASATEKTNKMDFPLLIPVKTNEETLKPDLTDLKTNIQSIHGASINSIKNPENSEDISISCLFSGSSTYQKCILYILKKKDINGKTIRNLREYLCNYINENDLFKKGGCIVILNTSDIILLSINDLSTALPDSLSLTDLLKETNRLYIIISLNETIVADTSLLNKSRVDRNDTSTNKSIEETSLRTEAESNTSAMSLTTPATATRLIDFQNMSSSTIGRPSLANRENPNAPLLTKPGYFTRPDYATIKKMSNNDLSKVSNFSIGCVEKGLIEWFGQTNVKKLNLDKLVIFNNKQVTVFSGHDNPKKVKENTDDSFYDDSYHPIGTGLNRPARVTLHNVLPRDISNEEIYYAYANKIKKKTKDMDAIFVSYNDNKKFDGNNNGMWVFEVKHFSSYGIDDDDDEYQNSHSIPGKEYNNSLVSEKKDKNNSMFYRSQYLIDPHNINLLLKNVNKYKNKNDIIKSQLADNIAKPNNNNKKVFVQKKYLTQLSEPNDPLLLTSSEISNISGEYEKNALIKINDNKNISSSKIYQLYKKYGSKKNIKDISMNMRKSFRCSFGPAGVLVHLGGLSNISTVKIEKVLFLNKSTVENEVNTILLDQYKKERIKDMINFHIKYYGSNNGNDSSLSFSLLNEYISYYKKPVKIPENNFNFENTYRFLIFQLIYSLWGKIDNDNKLIQIYNRDQLISKWFKLSSYLYSESPLIDEKEINPDDRDYLLLLSYLAHNNIEKACETARKTNNYYLSILLSCYSTNIFSSKFLSTNKSTDIISTHQFVQLQIEEWEKNGKSPMKLMNPILANIYYILAGNVSKCDFTNLDWLKTLAIFYWYSNNYDVNHQDLLFKSFSKYQKTAINSNFPYPYWQKDSDDFRYKDILYALIDLYCNNNYNIFDSWGYTTNVYDIELVWYLSEILPNVISYNASENSQNIFVMDTLLKKKIQHDFVFQLECLGLWEYAIYILLYNNNNNIDVNNEAKSILFRHWPPTKEIEIFLVQVKIPTSWLSEGYFIYNNNNYMKYMKSSDNDKEKYLTTSLRYLFDSGQLDLAHQWIILKLVPFLLFDTNMINNHSDKKTLKYEKLVNYLTDLNLENDVRCSYIDINCKIKKWHEYGGLFLSYSSLMILTRDKQNSVPDTTIYEILYALVKWKPIHTFCINETNSDKEKLMVIISLMKSKLITLLLSKKNSNKMDILSNKFIQDNIKNDHFGSNLRKKYIYRTILSSIHSW